MSADDYQQILEGEWIRPTLSGHRNQCCGCGLVHVLDFVVVDRSTQETVKGVSVHVRTRLASRETAAARRRIRRKKVGK